MITVEEEWEVDNVEDLEEDTFLLDKVFPILNDLPRILERFGIMRLQR